MNNLNEIHASKDNVLRWTMRIIGVLLLLASVFVLTRDITQAANNAVWFFGIAATLGTVTVITSWIPSPQRRALQESPVLSRRRK